MPTPPSVESFEYATIRVVPRVEREEFLNAGVVLFCRPRRFLGVRVGLDPARLRALAPDVEPEEIAAIERQLDLIARIGAGDPDAGPIARLPIFERWHWLVAPASTVVQPSAVHTGLCDDPRAALDRLFAEMVVPSRRADDSNARPPFTSGREV